MVRESQEGTLGDALGGIVGRAAIGAIVGAVLLLALGLVAELLRRRHRALRLLALLDLTIPTAVRAAIISVLALTASLAGPRPANADDSVRGWLNQTNASSTTTTPPSVAPIATPDAISSHDPVTSTTTATTSTTAPTGRVVLIPPLTIEREDETPAPSDQAAGTPNVATPSTTNLPVYVVQRGDCLWSIAERLLGAGATAPAIDAGWRHIYAANRAAIGDNPNLIHIGLTLSLPPLDAQP